MLSDWREMADAVTDADGLGCKGSTAAANIIQLICSCARKALGSDLIPGRKIARFASLASGNHCVRPKHCI